MSSAFYTSTAVDLREGAGRLPDGTPLFLDAKAKRMKVGDLVGLALAAGPAASEMGIVMELISDDPLLSLGQDVRIVKVKWLRSGVGSTYRNDLIVIAK